MTALEVIRSRRSTRAFLDTMPPKKVMAACLEAATWAPSASNQQPWEFIVLAGEALKQTIQVTRDNFAARIGEFDPFAEIPEQCRKRQQEIMVQLAEVSDREGIDPGAFFESMLEFFSAPVGVYFVTYRRTDEQYLVSAAAALENFLLAAEALGLGTCWISAACVCQEDIKKHLGLADACVLIGGVAVGYGNPDSELNTFERTRRSVEECTTWLGF